jgi:hypothetical protein
MNLLGSVGQLYMLILLVLLFLGSGFALWRFINFLMERGILKQGVGENLKQKITQNNNVSNKVKGGLFMANNGWIKLAVFSFVGIIVSVAILGLLSTNKNNVLGMNMNGQGTNIHQQHQQQGMLQNGMNDMNMQGGMNVNTPMGNLQMQGNMNMPMNGEMNQNTMLMMMQQHMYQMQMQLNQMQQQMDMMHGNMGGNMQMQQGGMNNMGGMGMMNGMMGGMGMM